MRSKGIFLRTGRDEEGLVEAEAMSLETRLVEEILGAEGFDLEARALDPVDEIHAVEAQVIHLTEAPKALGRRGFVDVLLRPLTARRERYLDQGPTAGSQHPVQLGQNRPIVAHVLEDVGTDHGIETRVGEPQAGRVHPEIGEGTREIDRDEVDMPERRDAS